MPYRKGVYDGPATHTRGGTGGETTFDPHTAVHQIYGDPHLWKPTKIKLREDRGKIRFYKSLPVKLFVLASLPYFYAQGQFNLKEMADIHTCKDLVAICFNRIKPRKEDTMKLSW